VLEGKGVDGGVFGGRRVDRKLKGVPETRLNRLKGKKSFNRNKNLHQVRDPGRGNTLHRMG